MPAKPITGLLISRIRNLRGPNQGRTLDEIESELIQLWPTLDESETGGKPNPPHRNTIQKYTSEYDALPDVEKAKDLPIDWTRLNDYDIPWEASGQLLDFWKRTTFGKFSVAPLNPHPTARQVKWWWRVMCAAPGASDKYIDNLAHDFAEREQWAESAPDEQVAYRDLWAFIAFRPWTSQQAFGEYLRALEMDREGQNVDWSHMEIKDGKISGWQILEPIALDRGITPLLINYLMVDLGLDNWVPEVDEGEPSLTEDEGTDEDKEGETNDNK